MKKICISISCIACIVGGFVAHAYRAETTPAEWYSQGCQAYRNGEYAAACCLWKRAGAVGGTATVRERCEHNCQCAYQKLGIEVSSPSLWQRIRTFFCRIPFLWLQLLFLILLYALLIFVYQGIRLRKTRVMQALLLGTAFLVSSLLLVNSYLMRQQAWGVVVQEQQLLYAGPGSDYPECGKVTCGQTVELCNRRGEWYKVRPIAGGVGWMPCSAFMSVKP